ncbi:MAG: CAP domain-containing protein [Anaerolactibacter massiliensis]|nr:CAP domain-containing protein [Anaerolactibacter massiliensis]
MEEAQAKINQGALGFYQSLAESDSAGSSNAVSILTKASVNDQLSDNMKTKIGAEGDATSLENMKKALDFLASGSQLRAADHPDLTKWKVTNTIMAAAQVYTNAKTDAAGEYTLTYQAYNEVFSNGLVLQEQISGTGIGEDLYQGWYTEEKAVLEYYAEYIRENNGAIPTVEEVASALNISVDKVKTTHYQRIIDSNYEYTGIGYNNNSSQNANGDTAVQIFAQPASGEKSYTIDEYRALFDAYYSSVTKALTDAQADLAAKQSALAELQKNGGLTDKEVQAIADAEAAADQKYSRTEAEAANTRDTGISEAEKEREEAKSAAQDAKDTADAKAAADYAQKEAEAQKTRDSDSADAEAKKSQAEEEVKAAKEAVDEAQADVYASEAEVTDAKIAEAEAEKQAADAEEAEQIAEEVLKKYQEDLDAAQEALDVKLQDTAESPADAGMADDVVEQVKETTTDPTVTFDFDSATITVGQ